MVRITKQGVFFDTVNVDDDTAEFTTIDVLSSSDLGIVSYLSYPVQIEPGVTVRNIMDLLALNMEAVDVAFDSSLGGHSFAKFHLEMLGTPMPQLYTCIEVAHESDPVETELFSTVRIRGAGPNDSLYSVEFDSPADYMDMEIKLNTEFCIMGIDNKGQEKKLFSTKKMFTLYEVIHSLLFEMSYYGGDEERKTALESVLDSVGIDKIDGFKLNDRDDIEKLRRDMQAAIDREDYEAAAELRDRIKTMIEPEQNEEDKV